MCNQNDFKFFERIYYFEVRMPLWRRSGIFDEVPGYEYEVKVNTGTVVSCEDDFVQFHSEEEIGWYTCTLTKEKRRRRVILTLRLMGAPFETEGECCELMEIVFELTTRNGRIVASILGEDTVRSDALRSMSKKELQANPLMAQIEELKDTIIEQDLFIQPYLLEEWLPSPRLIRLDMDGDDDEFDDEFDDDDYFDDEEDDRKSTTTKSAAAKQTKVMTKPPQKAKLKQRPAKQKQPKPQQKTRDKKTTKKSKAPAVAR